MPVALFMMRESTNDLDMVDEDDDEEEYDADSVDKEISRMELGFDDDGIDWFPESKNSFQ